MRRTIVLVSVLPFVSAFFGGILALSLMVPSLATAQSNQAQEVRAAAFVLVGQNGADVARLEPGTDGNARLLLNAADGTRSVRLNGAGGLTVYDTDGATVRFQAGFVPAARVVISGDAQINGVILGPGGSISMLPPAP
jgi:hypothetical protein